MPRTCHRPHTLHRPKEMTAEEISFFEELRRSRQEKCLRVRLAANRLHIIPVQYVHLLLFSPDITSHTSRDHIT